MSVLELQQRLALSGYAPGPVDGSYGPRTLLACCEVIAGRQCISLDGAEALWRAMRGAEITTPLRIINFLANCGAETRFRITEENLNYSAKRLTEVWPARFPTEATAIAYARNPEALANYVYGGRMGNIRSGDGWRYRGRGWCQLTGREAYRTVGRLINTDLEANPELVLALPTCAAATAGFWTWKHLEFHADADDAQTLRMRWNGGLNGWPEVRNAVIRLKGLWGV